MLDQIQAEKIDCD